MFKKIDIIAKYQDAITLVITKVPNNLSEKRVIQSVQKSLKDSQDCLQQYVKSSSGKQREYFEKEIEFVNILLRKGKFGIFRMPDKEELLATKSMQDEKNSILNIVRDNLKYISKQKKDFKVSRSRLYDITSIINSISVQISKYFTKINIEIRKFILEEESRYSSSFENSMKSAKLIEKKLLITTSNEPRKFKNQLVNMMNDLEISQHLNETVYYIKCMDTVCLAYKKKNCIISKDIFDELEKSKTVIQNSLNWYNFLEIFRDKLNSYETQMRSNEINALGLMRIANSDEMTEAYKQAIWSVIKSAADIIDPNLCKNKQLTELNKHKVQMVKAVWSQSMLKPSIDCDSNILLVKGYNVLLSNVIQSSCFKTAKTVQILALNKVFIDANITKNLADKPLDTIIISPIWEIMQNTELNFNGTNAKTVEPAQSRTNGGDGAPGSPGGPGGQFIGMGQMVTGESQVNVYIRGGAGGDGQPGEKGEMKTSNINFFTSNYRQIDLILHLFLLFSNKLLSIKIILNRS